jgi:hypothetical protein
MSVASETNERHYILTDEQLLERIREQTKCTGPLDCQKGYELNEELVLVPSDTGRIWVPPDEDLQREILATLSHVRVLLNQGTRRAGLND